MKVLVDVVCRLIVGGVFVYASWSKIQDPGMFSSAVASYQLLPDFLVGLAAQVLPMLELLAALALMCTKWSRESSAVLTTLLLMFIVGMGQAWARGLEISCGCFGPEDPSDVTPLWLDILRDLALLVPAVWLVVRPNRWTWQYSSVCPLFAAIVLLASGDSAALSAPEVKTETRIVWITNEVSQVTAKPTKKVKAEELIEALKGTNEYFGVENVLAGMNGRAPAAVKPEVWSEDFPSALSVALAEHRPVVMTIGATNCGFCKRLEIVTHEPAFESWYRDTGIYLAHADVDVAKSNEDFAFDHRMAWAFARDTLKMCYGHVSKKFNIPLVAVYWKTESGEEIRRAFVGRRGMMPVKSEGEMHEELIGSLNQILRGYLEKAKPSVLGQ